MRRTRTIAVLAGAVASLVLPIMGGGTAGANVTDLSGSGAFGIQAGVSAVVPILTVGPIPSVNLPAGGGSQTASLANANVPLVLTTGILNVHTEGSNVGTPQGTALSSASVASLALLPAVAGGVTAGVLQSSCTSTGGGSVGTANIANLNAFGTAIVVSGTPNQTINLNVLVGTVQVIINEQVVVNTPGVETKITVNALHVKLSILGVATGDVVVSQSRCRAAGPDVLGGVGGGAGGGAAATAVTAGPKFTG